MVDDSGMLSKPIAYGVIGVGILISVVLAIQIALGTVTFQDYAWVIIFSYISNLVIVPLLMVLAAHKEGFTLAALVWLHISMGILMVNFSQVYSPFTVSWAILILLASMYYRWIGFWLSSLCLAGFSTAYIILFPEFVSSESGGLVGYSFLSTLVVIITVFASYMFVTVIMGAQKKNDQLMDAQRSERFQVTRLNTLINSISDAVVTLNRYGRVTTQNAAAQSFFDTNQSLIGREIDNMLALVDTSDKPVYVRQLINDTKATLFRDDLSSKRGEKTRLVSLQMSRIRGTFDDSEEYGVVLILRDITKQKSLEQEKDEFISVTSHELRTPVAIAEGSLSNLLLLDERKAERGKLREAAEDAHKQIIYLAKMINDLSTLSRAERGVGDIVEAIDVDALVHDLYNRYTSEAEAKQLQLNLDTESSLPKIETSRLYLEEILQNFITNSIKYTKTGTVTMGAMMEGEEKIRFYVKDTGIGMSQYDLDHIFQKFYRSEDYRTRESSGTGLGLYVVSKLAQKLNTKIDVESRLDHGSKFSFVVPLQITSFGGDAPKSAEQPKPASAPPAPTPVVGKHSAKPIEAVNNNKPKEHEAPKSGDDNHQKTPDDSNNTDNSDHEPVDNRTDNKDKDAKGRFEIPEPGTDEVFNDL